jgi:hypothetical protein
MKNTLILYLSIIALGMSFSSCEKDDPIIPNEEELITSLRYTLIASSSGTEVELSFVDLDGDGGNEPLINGATLDANETYSGSLELLNESISPAERITTEIKNEAVDHQFFFQSTVNGLTISYNDQDDEGNPLGLETTLNSGNAANGTLTIILRHKPNKSGSGVSDGNISEAGGETDIEVTFPINVE